MARSATFRNAGDLDRVAMTELSRGVTLRHLGRSREALADLDAALAHYEASGNPRFLAKIHEERAAAFALRGDFRAAHQAVVAQLAFERQLGEQLADERTSRVRVELDTARKEQENRALARENALKDEALAASQQALAAGERVRQLQLVVLALAAAVIASLGLLARRKATYGRRMRDLALTDELTRLPNRRHLVTRAGETLTLAAERDQPLSLVALDIDHFKRVNDTHGHAAGDSVLQRVAHAARSALRPGDTLGRTGGEEMVALLPATGRDEAARIAERLRSTVAALDCRDIAPDLTVTVSLGVAAREAGDRRLEAIWKRADDALYRAKAEGRNRVVVASA
jgi:diguanylate cyclase (GGDEF)-like protein